MKTIAIVLTALTLAVVLSGCLDTDVHTTVAANGSSDRTIRIKNDKPDLKEFAFPVPTEPSWAITRTESTNAGKKEYTFLAKKHFADPAELVSEYATRPDTSALRLTVELKKSFAWFYTYFEYSETYHFNNPYGPHPVSALMSPEEIDRLMRGDEDTAIKAKYDEWELRQEFESVFAYLLELVAKRPDGAALVEALNAHKEELMQRSLHATDNDLREKSSGKSSDKKNVKDTTEHTEGESGLVDLILRDILTASGLPVAGAVKNEVETAIAMNHEKDRRWNSLGGGFTSGVEMPGLLLESNSDDVKGSLVSWKFTDKQIRVHDVTMHASARVSNLWAFVVTGIGALLVIGLTAFSYASSRRNRRTVA